MLFIIDKEDSQTSDLCPELDGEFYLLGDEIEYFNSIIDYDDMWDLHEAHRRLDNGWKLVIFKPDGTIKGWGWLNTNKKELYNVYVNPLYRNKGIGSEIINSLHRYCQDWDKWWLYADDWNKASHKMLTNCGYKILL